MKIKKGAAAPRGTAALWQSDGSFDESYFFADLFDRLVFFLIIFYFFLLEVIASFAAGGYDKRAEFFDPAVLERFRHPQISPFGFHDLLNLYSRDDRVAAPVESRALASAGEPPNRRTNFRSMDFSASFSEMTPVRTRTQVLIQAVPRRAIPI